MVVRHLLDNLLSRSFLPCTPLLYQPDFGSVFGTANGPYCPPHLAACLSSIRASQSGTNCAAKNGQTFLRLSSKRHFAHPVVRLEESSVVCSMSHMYPASQTSWVPAGNLAPNGTNNTDAGLPSCLVPNNFGTQGKSMYRPREKYVGYVA